jgi:hypothetical protein
MNCGEPATSSPELPDFPEKDEFSRKNVEEARQLIEAGFDYVSKSRM